MVVWTRILIDGAIVSLLAALVILGSLRYNPRLWLQDYPKEIQAKVPPKTPTEKRQTNLVGILFMSVVIGGPLASTLLLKSQLAGSTPFLTLFANAFGVFFAFNLVDWLVIDTLILSIFRPRFVILPETEGLVPYQDYAHHLRGFLVGTVFSLVVGLLVASVAWMV